MFVGKCNWQYASCYRVAILKLYLFVSDDFLKGAVLYHSATFFIIKIYGIVLIGKNIESGELDGSS